MVSVINLYSSNYLSSLCTLALTVGNISVRETRDAQVAQAGPLERTVGSHARTQSFGRRNKESKMNTSCASANSGFHNSMDTDKDTAAVSNNDFLYVHVQFPISNVSALLDSGLLN